MSILRDAGLSALAEKFDPAEDTLDKIASELIVSAFASGKLFSLLGAVLEEDGVEWSSVGAEANGNFFASIKNKEDKNALRGSIVGILLGFLLSGVLALTTSPKSSAHVALKSSEAGENPKRSEDQRDLILENGTTSFVSSPEAM